MRRSLLFIPGNRPNMIQNGLVLPADALIFDLEDSVLSDEKDAARTLVASTLSSLDFGHKERVVRINELSSKEAKRDLEAVVPACVDTILLPKTEDATAILKLDEFLDEIENLLGLTVGRTKIIALIETALGVEQVFDIARASSRVTALALGAEDLAADLGCERTKEGREIFYSRTRLVIAARAAGVEALDTPFTDVYDSEGCYEDTLFAKHLGFDGKLSISPHHLAAIHRAFTPSDDELSYALEVRKAMEDAKKENRGAVSLRGRMIDAPVARQAERVIAWAWAAGIAGGEKDDETR